MARKTPEGDKQYREIHFGMRDMLHSILNQETGDVDKYSVRMRRVTYEVQDWLRKRRYILSDFDTTTLATVSRGALREMGYLEDRRKKKDRRKRKTPAGQDRRWKGGE
jgi:hypothetical protein